MRYTAAVLCLSGVVFLAGESSFATDLEVTTPESLAPVSTNSWLLTLWGGGAFPQTEDSNYDRRFLWAFGGDARGYFEYAPGRGLQLELAGVIEQCADDESCEGPGYHLIGGGHWISRHEAGAWGAFAAVSHTDYQESEDSGQHFIGGIEAAIFRGMTAYYAQLGGHVLFAGAPDSWNQGIFGKIGARHYFTEDSKLEGNLAVGGLGTWNEDAGPEQGFWAQWGVEYEHKLANFPLSGFIAYQGDLVDDVNNSSGADTLILHTAKIGVRLAVGGPTLMSRELGAGTFTLPDLHVPFSYTDLLF